jgi:hypothetical protein
VNALSLPRWAVWLLTPPIAAAAVAVTAQHVTEYRTHIREEAVTERANDECDGQFSQLANRLEVKQAVVLEYAAGRINLRQAAGHFRDLYQGDEAGIARLRRVCPSVSDDEQLYAAAFLIHLRANDGNPDVLPACQRAEREFRRTFGGSAAHAAP